jgi:16S rRNA processing protein RimM
MTEHNALISIGRLLKPHGVRGEVVFLPYVYDMTLLPDLVERAVTLQHPTAPAHTRTIRALRHVHKRVLMRFDGCEDMTQATALRDCEVLIPRDRFVPLPAGEYYWFEIEGLRVYTSDGHELGAIDEIIHTGSNDVYVVRNGPGEILVPALKDTVRSIDVQQGEMHLCIGQDALG